MFTKEAIITRDSYGHLLLKIDGNVCKHYDVAYRYRVPRNPTQKCYNK